MAECYCDYDYTFSVYRCANHVARKQHRCYECGRVIAPGERYEYAFGYGDGESMSAHTCQQCTDIRDWVVAHVPCCCWAHGNVHDDIRNTVDHYWPEAPGLLFGWLRRVAAMQRARGYKRVGHHYVKV